MIPYSESSAPDQGRAAVGILDRAGDREPRGDKGRENGRSTDLVQNRQPMQHSGVPLELLTQFGEPSLITRLLSWVSGPSLYT
jgi:hypothetical protein